MCLGIPIPLQGGEVQMIAHPNDAHKYGELKRELAKNYPYNIEAYMDGKDGFIKEMDRKAAEWHRELRIKN